MKYTNYFVFMLLIFISCKKVGSVDSNAGKSMDSISVSDSSVIARCEYYTFKDVTERADTLKKYVELAKTIEDKTICDRVIFYSFPDNFDGMLKLFGFDKVSKSAAPLYSIPFENNVITYFGSIQSIPKEDYYGKFINICVGGYWDADNIRQAFGFHKRLSDDTKSVSEVLSKRTDKDILSVFRFIFDGPHPRNDENMQIYKDLSAKLKDQDSRLAELLKTAYGKVLLQDDGHGK